MNSQLILLRGNRRKIGKRIPRATQPVVSALPPEGSNRGTLTLAISYLQMIISFKSPLCDKLAVYWAGRRGLVLRTFQNRRRVGRHAAGQCHFHPMVK
jgi:hypothetical protein